MRFALRPGISFCEAGGSIIFLDIGRNRYFGLSGQAEKSFRRLVEGRSLSAVDEQALAVMVEQGLLMNSDEEELPRPWPRHPHPERSLLDVEAKAEAAAVAGAVARLAASSLMLKVRPLGALLGTLKARKASLRADCDDEASVLVQTAGAFKLTALLASPLDKCLPRSLAVAHRLLDLGIPGDLVIGVRVRPFAAHCWVQRGPLLVNESVDQVRNFTAVLAV